MKKLFWILAAICWMKVTEIIAQQTVNPASRFDGWYNNLAHADWGTPGRPLTRFVSKKFASIHHDDVNDGEMPNPLLLSRQLLSGNSDLISTKRHSLLMVFFGQHLVDDIIDTRRVACPNQYMNVKSPSNENDIMPIYKSKFIASAGTASPFPTTPVNEATSWIDGSAIYGASASWADHLREFKDGKLKSEPGTKLPSFNNKGLGLINPTIETTTSHPVPRNPKSLLNFGNPRGNENVFLMVIGILFFRYHNYQAEKILRGNPEWSDEKIYEHARRWTIAVYQNIAAYEWLPSLTNEELPIYSGYNSFLEPGVSTEFSTAAMRIGHSMVPIGSVLRRGDCSLVSPLPDEFGPDAGEPAIRLCNTYWQLQTAILKHGIDDIVRGMAAQPSEQIDNVVDSHLREFLYGPVKRTKMDIETLTIQRGRDHGLPMYNSARKGFNLPIINDFNEFSDVLSSEQILALRTLYFNNTELIELYIGGILESRNGNLGELFSKIIQSQFIRLRDSDRFWFENKDFGFFNDTQIELIKNITLKDVILATTNITTNHLQDQVFNASDSTCPFVPLGSLNFTKPCSPYRNIQLFHGFWGKFATLIAFLIIFPLLCYFFMTMIAWNNQSERNKSKKRLNNKTSFMQRRASSIRGNGFSAIEIMGKNKSRQIVVEFIGNFIHIQSESKKKHRTICAGNFTKAFFLLSQNKSKNLFVVRVPKEYDLVLKVLNFEDRENVVHLFNDFFISQDINVKQFEMDEAALLMEAVTKEDRQFLLEHFFHKVFSDILDINGEQHNLNRKTRFAFGKRKDRAVEVVDCELSMQEMAEMLGMTRDSLFVKQMFNRADKDNSGYLSMREFTDLIILLMDGTPEQKVKLIFEMYDTDKSGSIEKEEGEAMIKSFLELASYNTNEIDIGMAVSAVFAQSKDPNRLTLEEFTNVMLQDHREAFKKAVLNMPGLKKEQRKSLATLGIKPADGNSGKIRKRSSLFSSSKDNESMKNHTINSEASKAVEEVGWKRMVQSAKRWTENYRRHIFCMVIFYAITIGLMVERAEHYAWHSEHTGIRRVTEFGIIMSRTTAAAISFHYSFILLTMCRNLKTVLRETFLNAFIPFDSAVEFHKHIAYVAIIETAIHVIGHVINVYHFSVHPLPVLACVFPKIFVDDGSDMPKTFIWWAFQNITGVTGILLVLVLAIIYVFSMQYSRRYCFRAFWWTHNLFVMIFVLTILHGSVGLVQAPLFHVYLAVPGSLYLIDKLVMISRSKVEISVVDAKPLPSNVLNLVFKRPHGFDYRSGQWVRIACLPLGNNEYHPFTLTSSPHEQYLSLHIRSVGPWTTNLRNLYKSAIEDNEQFPKIYLDGPFGEGHQDWYKYDVSVLVGAGIGITPFASILKDIVHKSRTSHGMNAACKKVYFIWVTRTQRHFEWLTDIIKDVEACDVKNLVDVHIYITQFHQKFDLRTTMLYICERYFQKIANTSLFTGLKAMTHFGRPQFDQFLNSIQQSHTQANRIGVFSCGPPGLTKGVEVACKNLNNMDRAQFIHYYENF